MKNYFDQVVALYEAGNVGMTGAPEVVPQENIADTGSDVMPQQQMMNPQMIQDPNMMGTDPNMAGQELGMDPMMMQQEPPPEDPSETLQRQRMKKLYGFFNDLFTYTDSFIESLKFIDINLLDEDYFKKVLRYSNAIKELHEKINDYMINIFEGETYEKNLYAYVLFRSEMVSEIKVLRDILKLNKPDEKLFDKNEE